MSLEGTKMMTLILGDIISGAALVSSSFQQCETLPSQQDWILSVGYHWVYGESYSGDLVSSGRYKSSAIDQTKSNARVISNYHTLHLLHGSFATSFANLSSKLAFRHFSIYEETLSSFPQCIFCLFCKHSTWESFSFLPPGYKLS